MPLASCLPRRRSSKRTRAPVATPPTPTATTGRTQLRGSRRARISESESSSAQSDSSVAAAAESAVKVSSIRPLKSSGGSIGRRTSPSSASTSQVDSPPSPVLIAHLLLELFDRAVNQYLGRPIGPTQRPRDLAVVHPQREAHDQRVSPVVGECLQVGHHLTQLLAPGDQVLGVVLGRDRVGVFQRRLRPARAVAGVVRGEVVRDPDQTRSQRPPVRLPPCPVEVPVGLQEGLLGEVLGVVVVPHPVVRV